MLTNFSNEYIFENIFVSTPKTNETPEFISSRSSSGKISTINLSDQILSREFFTNCK